MDIDKSDNKDNNTPSDGTSSMENSEFRVPPLSHNLLLPGAKIAENSDFKVKEKADAVDGTPLNMAKSIKIPKGFVPEFRLEKIWNNGQLPSAYKSKLKKTNWDPKNPPRMEGRVTDKDILFGRGNKICIHPGNVAMRQVVAINQPFYRELVRQEKGAAADALIAYFESRGARFIEEYHGKKFYHVVYDRVLEKFMQALRENIRYRTTSLTPLIVEKDDAKPPKPKAASRSSERISDKVGSNKSLGKKDDGPEPKKVVKRKKETKFATPKKQEAFTEAPRLPALEPPKSKDEGSLPKNKSRSSGSKTNSKSPPPAWSNVKIGDRLGIYWDLDKIYYPGTVEFINGSIVGILYDDYERETVDLSKNKFFRWKENLNKRLRPPEPTKEVGAMKAAKVKSLQSPSSSTQTQRSSDSENARHALMAVQTAPSVKFEGTFAKPVAAPVSSLADFLLRKINRCHKKSPAPVVTQTTE